MTIARVFDGEGWSTEQYDELIRTFSRRCAPLPGAAQS